MTEREPVTDTILKQFDRPDEVRDFEKGRIEIVRLGPMVIGRATYQPGWNWSQHVGPGADAPFNERGEQRGRRTAEKYREIAGAVDSHRPQGAV